MRTSSTRPPPALRARGHAGYVENTITGAAQLDAAILVVSDGELLDTSRRHGGSVEMSVMLGKPIAMDVGLGFAIREGNRTVGAGTVRELLDCPRRAVPVFGCPPPGD